MRARDSVDIDRDRRESTRRSTDSTEVQQRRSPTLAALYASYTRNLPTYNAYILNCGCVGVIQRMREHAIPGKSAVRGRRECAANAPRFFSSSNTQHAPIHTHTDTEQHANVPFAQCLVVTLCDVLRQGQRRGVYAIGGGSVRPKRKHKPADSPPKKTTPFDAHIARPPQLSFYRRASCRTNPHTIINANPYVYK